MFSLYLIVVYVLLLCFKATRRIALALLPWLVFACSYDFMRLVPNYTVNEIDLRDLYESEKQLFGIASSEGKITLCEFFASHHCAAADILAGLFYLCWVPLPLCFGLYMYIKGDRRNYLRFSLAFLFVNLIGFCGYYIHPAAPPWYVMNYGFEPIINTTGNVAGLGRFDALTGVPIFHLLYGKNSNVFAAIPSLHAAYMLIATVYAIISRQKKIVVAMFATVCVGIWWTAVYSGHHYVIDILLGIATAVIGITLLESLLFRLPAVQRMLKNYESAI